MKIAYQGEELSNSEFAARQLAELVDMKDYELVPRRSSERVVDYLRSGSVDYGVVAIKNSIFGEVAESKTALQGLDRIQLADCTLPIHHCLYSLSKDVTAKKLTHIYSHPQALGQCKQTLAKIAPKAVLTNTEDTAFAARQLASGNLSNTSGVLCRHEAGEKHGLHLLRNNVEDSSGNSTTFILFSVRPSNITPKVGARDRAISLVCQPFFVRWGISGLLTVTILGTLMLNAQLGWSGFTIVTSIVGTACAAILALTSPKYVLWAQHYRILGYWKYIPIPKRDDAPLDEKHHIERVVVVDRVNGQLRLRGWQAGDGEPHRWESAGTMFKHSSDASGQLVYEYRNTLSHKQSTLVGIVSLYWNTSDPAQSVPVMSGLYYGHGTTQDDGTLSYQRITQSEFEMLRFFTSIPSEGEDRPAVLEPPIAT